ncbi:MAG: anti-sigma factor antagonist [Actinobacteria bacterium]|nr:anti-sigma factor antagonist [Actinomycetota bacterium]
MPEQGKLLIQTIQGITLVIFEDESILDPLQVQDIGEKLHQLIEQEDRQRLILDFHKVKILSSQMLGVLIGLLKRIRSDRGRIVICGMKSELHKVFKITNLDKLFSFYDTEGKALRSFESQAL